MTADGNERHLTILVDVDNTLLDNDRAKADLDRALGEQLGEVGRARFWEVYEAVRAEQGVVSIPLTLAAFDAADPDPARRRRLAALFMTFPYADYLYPGATAALAHLLRLGRVVILSDGDPVFQVSKIWRAGLTAAVDGNVLVFDHKEQHVAEIAAAYPSERWAVVDDKPPLLRAVAERLPGPTATVLVRQGHYYRTAGPGAEAGMARVLGAIGEAAGLTAADLRAD